LLFDRSIPISKQCIQNRTVSELLSDYGAIIEELCLRKIVRSSNNPLSDYAELLFCKAFGWSRENNSTAGHDATDSDGVRYQIKGRRLTHRSRQLSAIRNLDQVIRAALIPVSAVRDKSVYVSHSNSWRFLLRDDVWNSPGVRDVTNELCAAAKTT
jgi:hypothetical protein